ncbi:hypothetical protein cypCar_00026500 [Cyprinus carpio]|nr:hypothetical protein cypCar_00026500 [Cyprinus carpio]
MGDAAEIKESRRTFIVPTIRSVDHYDFTRAKISCSLTWLIAKAFGSAYCMSSHLALIDTLMMAYTVEMVSVERVLTCIQKFTPFLPEEDFPYDAEEAVTTWINKVNEHLRDLLAQEQRVRDIEEPCTVQKGRYRREDYKAWPVLCLPLVDNLLKDNTDGCSLAALLHFYCPDAVPLEGPSKLKRDSLKVTSNYLVFMAELFWWCEVVKPSFVQPRTLSTKVSDPSQSNKMAPITKQNLIHRPGSPDQSRSQPKIDNSVIRQSSSLSYVDGCVGTWPKEKRYSNGVSADNPSPPYDAQPNTPSIEEALKIIHDSERPHSSLEPPSGDSAFFLHSPSSHNSSSDPNDPEDSLSKARDVDLNSTSTDMDTGIHVRTEDIQDGQDEDSSLKDYSDMDQDFEARSCPLPEISGNPCPNLLETRSLATSMASSLGSAVRMTSFAEQKFRKLSQGDGRSSGSGGNTPESGDLNVTTPGATGTVRSNTPDAHSPSRITSPRDTSHLLASEMVQLKMKLEEKRRAIEAHKKKVEAAFTRHRQRMGRTAFLNVVRRKGVVSPLGGDSEGPDGREIQTSDLQLLKTPLNSNDSDPKLERCRPDGAPPKSPLEEAAMEVDLAEYTRSIERLNTSLSFLQSEMQRLAQQQEHIMQMPEHQSWVISPPEPSPRKQMRELRSSSLVGRGSVGSLSPILSSTGSPRTTHRSPSTIKRKSASFHARTPRTPRPNELKVTPFSRMLNTQQSVDSLPRLRRFWQSQAQPSPFAYLGDDEGPSSEDHTAREKSCKKESKDAADNSPSAQVNEKQRKEKQDVGESNQIMNAPTYEVLSQPTMDHLTLTASGHTNEDELHEKKNLIEVPLSVLKPLDGHDLESSKETETGLESRPDQKMCCGFFYRDDLNAEEDIAQKKAALMEKRLRREKEMQIKKQQQEAEMEQKKEAARLKAEEEREKKEDEKSRRDYIKNECLRKKQLKLMDDMDSVIKPRPPSVKQKKPRPKSMHRDIMESPKPPARTTTGSRPRGYSVSSLSLASLNLADTESVQSDKRTSRGSRLSPGSLCFFLSSPKGRKGRPESTEGVLSPCPSVSGNGENWELESTTSSAASNAEYTGPKLYKEPSAKSNKHIIQNALAHCCLAGRVNEGQKNKILEEMEKTEANNFLILFRDSGCQFRSLYTYYPEVEEINKLAGIGPKTITPKMIENLYKYSSDKKQFSKIPAKTMSASVDAITIYSHLWQIKKQNTPKKLLK